jgi:4-alpha-glucanotransferase
LFSLDNEKQIACICGVPPDYFSRTGQLWNMPTYRWDRLKEQNYEWWIGRLQTNLLLFDLLRLDHFRAFEKYWEVPAGEETAVNGKWMPGPGAEFFRVIEEKLGKLPFVAEDLGDNMEDVYRLREETGLPGMKVLQFAFGDNMPVAVDIPHNFPVNCIVYTGTHDNNTALGWYHQETTREHREHLEKYTGQKISAKRVHLVLGRLAYGSVARIAILPVQDVLGLDETQRINTPGSDQGNWLWRLQPGQLGRKEAKLLRRWCTWFNRK